MKAIYVERLARRSSRSLNRYTFSRLLRLNVGQLGKSFGMRGVAVHGVWCETRT